MGILANGMWKDSFTSSLSVKKTVVLFESLADLLVGGVLPLVQTSSAQEGNFRSAKIGPFKEAWAEMKNGKKAFWSERSDAFESIMADRSLALFDFPIIVNTMEPYLTCKIESIPGKYFKGQWAMPVGKQFLFSELFNLQIMKMRNGGNIHYIFKQHKEKNGGKQQCGKSAKGSSLGMKPLISAFIILIAGILISLCIILVENLIKG